MATALAQPTTAATVLYGNRRSSSVMFLEELSDLKNTYPARLALEPSEIAAGFVLTRQSVPVSEAVTVTYDV